MPETTKNYRRIPVRNKAKDAKIRTINLGKGIKALYDVKNKVIVTYLFDKTQYSMKQAKDWVKKHKDNAAINQIIENTSLATDMAELYKELYQSVLDTLND